MQFNLLLSSVMPCVYLLQLVQDYPCRRHTWVFSTLSMAILIASIGLFAQQVYHSGLRAYVVYLLITSFCIVVHYGLLKLERHVCEVVDDKPKDM